MSLETQPLVNKYPYDNFYNQFMLFLGMKSRYKTVKYVAQKFIKQKHWRNQMLLYLKINWPTALD